MSRVTVASSGLRLGSLAVLVPALLLGSLCAGCAGAGVPANPSPVEAPPPEGMLRLTGAPPGGLPYHLFMPQRATPERPLRLLVWMHPSGASGLELLEPLAGTFAQAGYALLTLPEKDFSGWRGVEANRLMLHTLPAVGQTPGVEVRHPVLLGFSAGAQMALELWAARPESFGGLLLVAGAPRFSRGDEHAPPHDPGHARVPLFAFIGEHDGSAPLWREALGPWRAAGVPLQVREVPGKGHEWLLSQQELATALEWLRTLPWPGQQAAGAAGAR